MNNMTYKLTPTVCAELGMTPAALNSWLSRNQRFKPKQRGPDGFLWTDQEIESIRRARATQPTTATNRNTART